MALPSPKPTVHEETAEPSLVMTTSVVKLLLPVLFIWKSMVTAEAAVAAKAVDTNSARASLRPLQILFSIFVSVVCFMRSCAATGK
jgi:hypothetical protein